VGRRIGGLGGIFGFGGGGAGLGAVHVAIGTEGAVGVGVDGGEFGDVDVALDLGNVKLPVSLRCVLLNGPFELCGRPAACSLSASHALTC
jgi:hypothetical protein